MGNISNRQQTALIYSAAHYGKSLFWYSTEFLFGFYLAEIYEIPPESLGPLLAIFLLWDAITDPLIGLLIAGRTITTKGLMKAQVWGALLSAVTFLLVFVKPPINTDGLVVYALLVGLAFRTAYTLFDVPQNTLLKRMAEDNKHRLTLSSLRTAFSAIATLTISLASAYILSDSEQAGQTLRFTLAAFGFSAFAILTAFVLVRFTAPAEVKNTKIIKLSLLKVLKATLLDPATAKLFSAIFFLSLGWPLFAKLIAFYAEYVWLTPALTGVFIATIAIASLLSQPIWTFIGHRSSRNGFLLISLTTFLIGTIGFGLWARVNLYFTIPAIVLMSAGSSALSMLIWTRLADNLTETNFKASNDVLAFGFFTFASKIALSLGGLMLGSLLSLIGYERDQPLNDMGQMTLTSAMAVIPAVSGLLASTLVYRTSR